MGKKENENYLDMWGINSTMFKDSEKGVEEINPEDTILKTVDGKEQISDEIIESEKKEELETKKEVIEKDDKKEDLSEEGTEFISLIESLSDVLVIDDEKEYEPNTEGLKALIKDTAEKASKDALNSLKENLGEKEKVVLDVLSKGGSLDEALNFIDQVDYTDIPLQDSKGTDLERNQLNLVADWMKIQGFEQEDIDEKLDDLKSTGLLYKEAKLAQKKLVEWQEKEVVKFTEEKEKQRQVAEEQVKAEQIAFKNKVTSLKEVAGFKISSKQAEELYDYITKPVNKEGKTKFALEDTEENRLLYAYFAMIGFDKEKLSKEITTKKVIKLKEALSNYQDTNTKTKTSQEMRRGTESLNIPWTI